MKKIVLIALTLVALALPYGVARSADWTELQSTFAERLDGKIEPDLGVAWLHYINDRAIGINYSGPEDGGGGGSWRVYERGWQSGWTFAAHVNASANFLDGKIDNDVTGGIEFRIGWPEIGLLKQVAGHGDGEILLGVGQWQFADGSKPEYAINFGLAWWPTGRD